MLQINYEISQNEQKIAEIISDEILINNTGDMLDIIGDISYNGSNLVIFQRHHFSSEFFDLKTKIAGDVFQKIVNYQFRIAIVGDFSQISSNSLRDFIRESNKMGVINFVKNIDDAKNILSN